MQGRCYSAAITFVMHHTEIGILLRFGPGFTVMLFECHIRVLKG